MWRISDWTQGKNTFLICNSLTNLVFVIIYYIYQVHIIIIIIIIIIIVIGAKFSVAR